MEAIKCKGVSFTYPKNEQPALSSVTFSLNEGEFCLLTGASAAGKSTLLKLLKKEIAPYGTLDGEIEISKSVGYVGQRVEENIVCDKVRSELTFGLTNLGLSESETELLTAETASYFNLEEKLDSDISLLSGGEKQLVNLAAVMIMKPEILILDEPCSQLDPVSAERFVNMVKKLHSDFNITVIMSEHSTQLLFDYADSVMLLDGGRLTVKAPPEEYVKALTESGNKMLAAVPAEYRYINPQPKDIQSVAQKPETELSCKNVYFAYEKGKFVLNGVNLEIYKGKINAVVGANGSGKSTLLKVMCGVLRKFSGKVKAKRTVAMLTQNVYDLFTKDRCCDEVEFGENTSFLEIDYIKDRHPYDLSGGEAQRLALAMVLERDADIILLDEPTKGFDAVLKLKLGELLRELCKKGKTVVIVSHDIDFTGTYCDYCSFLSRGKIICTAPRRDFFSRLSFYTTSLSRMTNGKCISFEDIDE